MIGNLPSDQIFISEIVNKRKISSPKLPEIVSRVPEIVVRAPQGRSLESGGRPRGSQPPSRGARGRYPGPSESFVLFKEKQPKNLLKEYKNELEDD